MVIECKSCRARYRMRPSMLQGFQGAEVRCRRCGGTIVVAIPGSHPGTPEPGNLPERNHRPTIYEKEAQREAGVPGRAPGPGNVYSLDRWRESRPKRLPVGGYDISGCIRPEPTGSLALENPSTGSSKPFTAPPEEQESVRSGIIRNPFDPQNEEIPSPLVETAHPPPDEMQSPAKTPKRRWGFLAGSSRFIEPRPSHIVFLYLMLLVLGGCGYLLVRFLSRIMNGGIG